MEWPFNLAPFLLSANEFTLIQWSKLSCYFYFFLNSAADDISGFAFIFCNQPEIILRADDSYLHVAQAIIEWQKFCSLKTSK